MGVPLKIERALTIRGDKDINAPILVTIRSTAHSVSNKAKLVLSDIALDHCLSGVDNKLIGACTLVRNTAKVDLSGVKWYSCGGFCIWTIQYASVHMTCCSITSELSSC